MPGKKLPEETRREDILQQAVIDPNVFSVEQHFDAAGQMLGRLANDRLIAATACGSGEGIWGQSKAR